MRHESRTEPGRPLRFTLFSDREAELCAISSTVIFNKLEILAAGERRGL